MWTTVLIVVIRPWMLEGVILEAPHWRYAEHSPSTIADLADRACFSCVTADLLIP